MKVLTLLRILVIAIVLVMVATVVPAFAVMASFPVHTAPAAAGDELIVAVVSGVVGAGISLVCSLFPGLRLKWAVLDKEHKRSYMILFIIGASALIFTSSCLSLWVLVPCTKFGAMRLAEILFFTVIGNQVIFPLTPTPTDVRSLKEAMGGSYG